METGVIEGDPIDYQAEQRERLAEARRLEQRRRDVFADSATDILKAFSVVMSVSTVYGIKRAQAHVEALRGRMLAEIYVAPQADDVPFMAAQPMLGTPGDDVPGDPYANGYENALSEFDPMLAPSRKLNAPPVSPEMYLRRELAEDAAREAARAEFDARPLDLLTDWASIYPGMPAECEAATQADALVRERERDRELDFAEERALPRWDTVDPDVPPPLSEEHAAILAKHTGNEPIPYAYSATGEVIRGRSAPQYEALKEIRLLKKQRAKGETP